MPPTTAARKLVCATCLHPLVREVKAQSLWVDIYGETRCWGVYGDTLVKPTTHVAKSRA